MSPVAQTRVSPEEYLAAERLAEIKSEYLAGEVHAMTGASRPHNLIVTNVVASLVVQLRGKPCQTYASDMRVKVPRARAYVYPDVAVVCGEPELEDEQLDTLLNPTLIIEVLSPSTADYDHGRKWEHYRRLGSLQDYLLIAQDQRRVERYTRRSGGMWLFSETTGSEVVSVDSIGCALVLDDVYDRVHG